MLMESILLGRGFYGATNAVYNAGVPDNLKATSQINTYRDFAGFNPSNLNLYDLSESEDCTGCFQDSGITTTSLPIEYTKATSIERLARGTSYNGFITVINAPEALTAVGAFRDCFLLNNILTLNAPKLTTTRDLLRGATAFNSFLTLNILDATDLSLMLADSNFNKNLTINATNPTNITAILSNAPFDSILSLNWGSITTALDFIRGTVISTANWDSLLIDIHAQGLAGGINNGVNLE